MKKCARKKDEGLLSVPPIPPPRTSDRRRRPVTAKFFGDSPNNLVDRRAFDWILSLVAIRPGWSRAASTRPSRHDPFEGSRRMRGSFP
jgi:hypothetical protein